MFHHFPCISNFTTVVSYVFPNLYTTICFPIVFPSFFNYFLFLPVFFSLFAIFSQFHSLPPNIKHPRNHVWVSLVGHRMRMFFRWMKFFKFFLFSHGFPQAPDLAAAPGGFRLPRHRGAVPGGLRGDRAAVPRPKSRHGQGAVYRRMGKWMQMVILISRFQKPVGRGF